MTLSQPLRLLLVVAALLGFLLGTYWLSLYGSSPRDRVGGEDLLGTLQFLRDPSGRLELPDIVQRDGQKALRPASKQDLNAGYTRDVLWFATTLRNDGKQPLQRYLVVSPPRLEDVRVFVSGQGPVDEMHNGLRTPVAERRVSSRLLAFPVDLAPGEARRVYVRIRSNNAILLEFRQWEPTQFHLTENHINLYNGLQLGALLLFALYAFIAAASTRERTFVYFGITLLSYAMYDVSIFQYGLKYLWTESPDWALRAPGVFMALVAFGIGMVVTELIQSRQRFNLWNRLLALLAVAALLCTPGLLLGDYRYWVQYINYLALAVLVANMGAIITAFLRGEEGAGLALAAFLLLWFSSLVRVGQIIGLLPFHAFWEYSQGWTMVMGGMLMAVTLGERLRRLRSAQENARLEIVAAQIEARLQAEQTVLDRTRELRAARDEAEATSRAKSAFIAQLSHELRTPLHSILGYSGLIAGEAEDPESRRRGEAIRRSGRHLLALIDELLDYARGEAGRLQIELQPLRLRELLDAVVEETRGLAREKGARLEVRLAPDLPEAVLADSLHLRQVLINLVANACHHSQAGVIRLDASATAGRDAGHRRLRLAVSDDGVGIAEADRERIFQPFEQGSDGGGRKGMGLGLAISRQLASLMGGQLTLQELAPGCRFSLEFEAELIDLPATPRVISPRRRYAGPVRRVLVVDDLADNRELLCVMLQQMGFAVSSAENGPMALDRLAEEGIDLVLSDQLMPGMDGWELLAEARRRGHAMPIVLVSAAVPVPPDDAGPTFAATLMKPVDAERLAETLGRCLGLAWRAEEGNAPPPPAAPRPPSAAALAALDELARQGLVSDIEDWVTGILEAEPDAAEFARAVREAVRRLDLEGLMRMTEKSRTTAHPS